MQMQNMQINNHATNVNQLKDIWTQQEIAIVNNLLTTADDLKKSSSPYKYLIDAIDSILNGKDDEVSAIILKMTTSL
jgi:tRNA A37 threonylcarbamoyladenosine dehydratase